MGYDVKKLWKGNRLQIRYPVIYGGDGTRPSGEPFVLGVQGALGHKQKPQCVHISNVHAGLLPTDVYSSMYARMTVNFFPYDASGNRGVGFGLGNVCKTRDGEPLGSRANAVRQRTPGTLSQLVRTALVPKPGYKFVDADFSAIEARVVAWLAGKEWVLQVFRTHDKIYEATTIPYTRVHYQG